MIACSGMAFVLAMRAAILTEAEGPRVIMAARRKRVIMAARRTRAIMAARRSIPRPYHYKQPLIYLLIGFWA